MLRARETITYETGVEMGESLVVRAGGSLGRAGGAQAPHTPTLSSSMGTITLNDPRDLRYVVSRLLPNLEKKLRDDPDGRNILAMMERGVRARPPWLT